MKNTCFISHGWGEGGHDFAKRLAQALRAHNVEVWLDENEIHAGEEIEYEIWTAVRYKCDVFLFVLSPASVESRWCAREVAEALKCRHESGLQVIPILFQDCEIPSAVSSLRYVDFRDQMRFDERVEHLLPSIRAAARIRSLVAELTNGDFECRANAAWKLGMKRNPFTVPVLIRHLFADAHPTVRGFAASALGLLRTEEALTALRQAKEQETDPFVLLEIGEALR